MMNPPEEFRAFGSGNSGMQTRESSSIVGDIAASEIRTVNDLNGFGMASLVAEGLGREQMPWGWIQVVASNSFGLCSKVIHLKHSNAIRNVKLVVR